MSVTPQLAQGLAELALSIGAEGERQLADYCALLAKWNRVYNLTALRDEHMVVSHHLLDSLAVLPQLSGTTVVDVGSGGGLPGIPLAIARPDWQLTLVESNHKKASFLMQARIELGLANVTVINRRVEDWQPEQRFDTVVSRAFSDLAEFVSASAHLLAPDGTFAAMKGVRPDEELALLPSGYELTRAVRIAVPGLAAQRHLILLRRSAG